MLAKLIKDEEEASGHTDMVQQWGAEITIERIYNEILKKVKI